MPCKHSVTLRPTKAFRSSLVEELWGWEKLECPDVSPQGLPLVQLTAGSQGRETRLFTCRTFVAFTLPPSPPMPYLGTGLRSKTLAPLPLPWAALFKPTVFPYPLEKEGSEKLDTHTHTSHFSLYTSVLHKDSHTNTYSLSVPPSSPIPPDNFFLGSHKFLLN